MVCLVGVLAAIALERLLRYQELAEKTAMEQTVGALRSAQVLQVAGRITQGGLASVQTLVNDNPMDWLAQRPANYAGAVFDPAPDQVPRGGWCFDLKRRELVYRPNMTRFFTPAEAGAEQIRFRIVIGLDPPGAAAGRQLTELTIAPVRPIRWTPEF